MLSFLSRYPSGSGSAVDFTLPLQKTTFLFKLIFYEVSFQSGYLGGCGAETGGGLQADLHRPRGSHQVSSSEITREKEREREENIFFWQVHKYVCTQITFTFRFQGVFIKIIISELGKSKKKFFYQWPHFLGEIFFTQV